MSGKLTEYLKPRNRCDYYRLGRLMFSKRLAYVLTGFLLLLSLMFLLACLPAKSSSGSGGYPVFSERSLPLKFYRGKVEVRDKEGNVLYRGSVKKGAAWGEGTAYGKNGLPCYSGEFQGGSYEGEGTLYRENGTVEYKGSFRDGEKDGNGTLCDKKGNPVYSGRFADGCFLYEALVGVDTTAVSEKYTGKQVVYTGSRSFCVYLPDIKAVYCGGKEDGSVEEEWKTDGLYVLRDIYEIKEKQLQNQQELKEYFGTPVYEGETILTFEDIVAYSLAKSEKSLVETEGTYEDARTVVDYKRDLELYIYSYEKDGFIYSFFGDSEKKGFHFYLIEEGEHS